MADAYLILENGTVFKGRQFGYDGDAVGELVFTTGMTGYMEALTDPRYYGQIVLQTFPVIGAYGVIADEKRSPKAHLKAYVVREWSQEPSNFRSEGNLDVFLRENKIPGLFGIDTRALTRIIRENGTINAMLTRKPPPLDADQSAALMGYKVADAVSSCASISRGAADGNDTRFAFPFGDIRNERSFNVALWDFGDTEKVIRELGVLGCVSFIYGHGMAADSLLEHDPDGIILSDGPDSPCDYTRIIEQVKKLCDKGIPMLGAGLGHQLLALARGAETEKLPFGHRGSNQPVKEIGAERAFVTNQNHGRAVIPGSLPGTAVMSCVNLNDGTCEGIDYADIPAFSVQFDPGDDVFARFIRMMEERR